MSDNEFQTIGQEFDLDAYIKSPNPLTVEEIIKRHEPILTLEQILGDLTIREQREKVPALPMDIAKQVETLEARIEKLEIASALGGETAAQLRALDEAISLADQCFGVH